MSDATIKIDCPYFNTIEEIEKGFGRNDPNVDGSSCTGCKNLKYMDGLMTCKYTLVSLTKGGF